MLTQSDREKLFDALAGRHLSKIDVPAVVQMFHEDVNHIAPVVEAIVERERKKAYAQGQLEVYLQLAAGAVGQNPGPVVA